MRASSPSARAGMIASSSGTSPLSSVSFTDRRYESVAAITSFPASNRTRIPVSTGRDSSRDAERETRETVSSSDCRSTVNVPTASRSGRRGKSSAAYVWSVEVDEPDVTCTTFSSGRYSIVHLVVRQKPHEVDQQTAGHDDGALSVDLRGDRRAQRQLHVRRGEMQPTGLAPQENTGQDLDARTRRDRSGDHTELLRELVALVMTFIPVSTMVLLSII